jgi:hypothetical protein
MNLNRKIKIESSYLFLIDRYWPKSSYIHSIQKRNLSNGSIGCRFMKTIFMSCHRRKAKKVEKMGKRK